MKRFVSMTYVKDRNSELSQAMQDPDPGLHASALLVGKCDSHILAFDMHFKRSR